MCLKRWRKVLHSPEGAAAENLCGIPAGQGEKRFDAVVCKRGKAKNRRYGNESIQENP